VYKSALLRLIRPNATSAFILLIVFSAVRFYLVLGAQRSGSYQYVSLIFIAMTLFTLFALNKDGWRIIGLKKPASTRRMLQVFTWGIIAALIMGLAANYNFGLTDQNWFVYISKSFGGIPSPLSAAERWIFFGIFSLIGMTFSPIGEEFFYRGLIHESLVPQLGQRGASIVDALAFSLVHLAHFGFYPTADGWGIYIFPAFLWVGFLFLTCFVFTYARSFTQSIWGAVAAHAGYNFGMNAVIFFYILD
jgi:membrane protease YdiL (CAAX protease family)